MSEHEHQGVVSQPGDNRKPWEIPIQYNHQQPEKVPPAAHAATDATADEEWTNDAGEVLRGHDEETEEGSSVESSETDDDFDEFYQDEEGDT